MLRKFELLHVSPDVCIFPRSKCSLSLDNGKVPEKCTKVRLHCALENMN